MALTDRHVLFGALDFYDAARKHHIKPKLQSWKMSLITIH
ncbi:hypothetical protein PT069_09240 [Erysipelothrix rhusiopathiae]|nr:hypothetical protein [Erysipelothrix rhusiopathiae]